MTVSWLSDISANFLHLEVEVAALVVNLVDNVQHLCVCVCVKIEVLVFVCVCVRFEENYLLLSNTAVNGIFGRIYSFWKLVCSRLFSTTRIWLIYTIWRAIKSGHILATPSLPVTLTEMALMTFLSEPQCGQILPWWESSRRDEFTWFIKIRM